MRISLMPAFRRVAFWGFLIGTAFCFHASAQTAPKARLIDSFHYTNSEDGSARIDAWRMQLETDPLNAGLIIVYGGKKSKRGEVEAHIRGIKNVFVQKRIDHERSPVIKGGFREKLTIEFWVIPPGAETPLPSATIDAKKVIYKGTAPKSIPYECCF